MKIIKMAIVCLALMSCTSKVSVTRVIDGDTFIARIDNAEQSVRLNGIDCFEVKKSKRAKLQAKQSNINIDGVIAKAFEQKSILENLLLSNNIKIETIKKDNFCRNIANVFVGNIDVNDYMTEKAKCFVY